MRSASLIFVAALLSAPIVATAQPAETATTPAEAEVSIPFTQFGSIRDWRPDGDRGLFIRGTGNQWYHATLMSKCHGINFTDTIGFDSEPAGNLDKFSSIRVDGQTCQFTSLVKSDPPTIERKSRKNDM